MRRPGQFGGVCAALALWLMSTTVSFAGDRDPQQNLSLMFYNIFNLFDAVHDEGKDDWTFLPKGHPGKAEFCETIANPNYKEECLNSDWTEANVNLKISQISKAVKAATSTLPDMLGLCEVENPLVVKRLAEKLGFEAMEMTNSPDTRGIDVALLYNLKAGLKKVRMEEHVMTSSGSADKPTRNVLEVEFEFNSQQLIVFVNHWPSQAAPAPVRVNVAKQVQKIVDKRLAKNPDANIILMGDFNTVDGDSPHAFNSVLMADDAKNPLLDMYTLFKADRNIPAEVRNAMPIGSYFFPPQMSWARLDRFFINKNLQNKTKLSADTKTFQIMHPDLITKTYSYNERRFPNYGTQVTETPFRPDIYTLDASEAGYSDHFPIYVELNLSR